MSNDPSRLGEAARPADADHRHLSDRQLIDAVAAELEAPRAGPTSSFELHAPLELLARAGLLVFVGPEARRDARRRIWSLGVDYERSGAAAEPAAPEPFANAELAANALVTAIDAGDFQTTDAAATWLAEHTDPASLARLIGPHVVDRLAAAGHAPIWFFLGPRVAPNSRAVARTLRAAAAELAKNPESRLRWHRVVARLGTVASGAGSRPPFAELDLADNPLAQALAAPPSPGPVESTYIAPTMLATEADGFAEQQLSAALTATPFAVLQRTLPRVAALAMLQEPDDHVPYGWTHCLTLPQAVLGLTDHGVPRSTAAAIAATHVLGFRATLRSVDLDLGWRPEPVRQPDREIQRLAETAACHRDAHLVKYVLACIDAVAADPLASDLYLRAAGRLVEWWRDADRAAAAADDQT